MTDADAVQPGTRIRFLRTLDEGPDDHAPGRHFCSKGEKGTVNEKRDKGREPIEFGYSVYADGWPSAPFLCKRDEFEVIS